MSDKLTEVRKCFQPWQWFLKEDKTGLPFEFEEEIFMWVYRKMEDGRFVTGYFLPDGNWFTDEIFTTVEDARARVRYLMGGNE